MLKVDGLPREVRDGISRFGRNNGVTVAILIEYLYDLLYNPHNLEAVSKGLELTLARWDPALYRRLGPWRKRKHEFGFYGVWVRIPNGTNNGDNHDPNGTTAPH